MTFFKGLPPAWRLLVTLTICYLLSALNFAIGDVAVPSYVYPCEDPSNSCAWTVFKTGANIVVINPDSGPGTSVNPDFTTLCNTVQGGSSTVQTVLGYVSTNYGNRASAQVLADIDAYYNMYFIDGIFLDEGSTSCSNSIVAKYISYDNRVKAHWGSNAITSLNWGTQGAECYLTKTSIDIYINFEGSYDKYVNMYGTNPSWVSEYDDYNFWHIVYGTPATASAVQTGVSLAQTRNAAYYYFTDDSGDNPYDTAPASIIWTTENA